MDRTKIKEHVVLKMAELLDNEYNVRGDFSEGEDSAVIIIGIANERSLTNRSNGRIGYNYITGEETILYTTLLTMSATVYAPIDEEAQAIAGKVQDAISRGRGLFQSNTLGIVAIYDPSSLSTPSMREAGKRKTWAVYVNFDISVSETVTV